MVDSFEQKMLIRYMGNLVESNVLPLAALGGVCDFFDSSLPFLGITGDHDKMLEAFDKFTSALRHNEGARKLAQPVRRLVKGTLKRRQNALAGAKPGFLAEILMQLTSELRLGRQEEALLGLLLRYQLHEPFYELLNNLTRENIGVIEVCAICLGMDRNTVRRLLGKKERLVSSGAIVQRNTKGRDIDDYIEVSDPLIVAVRRSLASEDNLRVSLLGAPAEANLDWDDYDHIAEARDRLGSFLTQAVEQQLEGVNILLYGPPGTGKTEFCKTLAASLQLNLYSLSEQDDSGGEPERHERMSGFLLAQNLLRYQKSSLLLFDEMDDLFGAGGLAALLGRKYSSGSKLYMNRLLENNPVPTIWTINEPGRLDETIIRRMSLAVEMKIPSLETRKRVWQRQLTRQGVELPDTDLKKLAQTEVSPGVVSNAVRFARLSGGTLEDYQFATQSIVRAIRGGLPSADDQQGEAYQENLVVADCDLKALTDRIVQTGRKDFSLCLYGPPGTGKSAYLRYLAERLDMPVLVKRSSDLISKWVGESEQNIAQAFAEAKASESFLIFDEADSLLADRRKARANWEIGQVNEMLTWMEQHPMPFACTTNLIASLDQAAMRRFTFKSHFDYLGLEEVCSAFQHFFGLQVSHDQLRGLDFTTPGDFAVVKKKVDFWGQGREVNRLVEHLRQEVAVKNESLKNSIGFQVEENG